MVGLITLCLIGGVITWFGIYVATSQTQPSGPCAANYTLECMRDNDGRFLAEVVPELPEHVPWEPRLKMPWRRPRP